MWRAIVACRTAALGGHVECCDRLRHDSPRLSLLPQPALPAMPDTRQGGLARGAAARTVAGAVLPSGVHLAPRPQRADRRGAAHALRELLFGAVAETLTEFAANPRWLGGTPAFSLVLHTWKQDLGRHVHVHALVAGGALTAQGEWVSPKTRLPVSGAGAVQGVSRQVHRRRSTACAGRDICLMRRSDRCRGATPLARLYAP